MTEAVLEQNIGQLLDRPGVNQSQAGSTQHQTSPKLHFLDQFPGHWGFSFDQMV